MVDTEQLANAMKFVVYLLVALAILAVVVWIWGAFGTATVIWNWITGHG